MQKRRPERWLRGGVLGNSNKRGAVSWPTTPRRSRHDLEFARYTIAPNAECDGAMTRFRSWGFRFNVCFLVLLADTELGDYVAVTIGIMGLQVVQQAAAFADEHKEATTRCVILLVGLEVLCQFANTLTQNRDLDFGGTGVRIVGAEAFNQ